jgi:cell wall-associated NlpC family hydrolase
MDCSGVFYYLLKRMNPHRYVPRDAYEQYMWLLHAGKIHHVTDENFHSYQFNALKPGDLLFWTGTYRTNRRPPITHVMMYLGKDKHNQPLMFGSSDGGIYKGKEMWGVSVFDFTLPLPRDHARFVAYGCIPHFTCK